MVRKCMDEFDEAQVQSSTARDIFEVVVAQQVRSTLQDGAAE